MIQHSRGKTSFNSKWEFLGVSSVADASTTEFPLVDGDHEKIPGKDIFQMNNALFSLAPNEKSRLNPLSSPLDMHTYIGRQDMFLDTFYPSTNSSAYNAHPSFSLRTPGSMVFQDFPLFDASYANKVQNSSIGPEANRDDSNSIKNSLLAPTKKRKVNRSQLSTDCLEILKKYKKSGICIPDKSHIPPDLELALMENYELLSSRRKLRCLPREWKVIAENLSKEECVQYLKYHRWKEPVTNAPKGSGCRVSQCAIHTGCNHLLKMRCVIV